MELAEYVPLDCPPKSAKPTNGVLFRMARKIPIADSEFVPQLVKKGADQFPIEDHCKASGLSVYVSEQDARKAIEDAARINPLARKSVVVKAVVDAQWGLIAPTPKNGNSHHTWWVPKGKTPGELFELVVSV